jgi:hypothetical protein
VNFCNIIKRLIAPAPETEDGNTMGQVTPLAQAVFDSLNEDPDAWSLIDRGNDMSELTHVSGTFIRSTTLYFPADTYMVVGRTIRGEPVTHQSISKDTLGRQIIQDAVKHWMKRNAAPDEAMTIQLLNQELRLRRAA